MLRNKPYNIFNIDNISNVQLTRYFMFFLLGSILSLNIPLPWKILSFIFSFLSLIISLIILIKMKNKHFFYIKIVIFIGLLLSILLILSSITTIFFWQSQKNYEECTEHAITFQAKQRCINYYKTIIKDRIPK